MRRRVEIVPGDIGHLEALLEIARASFPDPWSEEIFRQTLCSCTSRIFCAVDGQTVCGYAAVSRAGDAMNLDDIAITPTYRRQGIGTLLLDYVHEQFPELELWLEVRESNRAAIALYEKQGFRQVGFRKRYYRNPDEGAVLMTREAQVNDKGGILDEYERNGV